MSETELTPPAASNDTTARLHLDEPPQVGKSEWDLLAEIRGVLAEILAALKTPHDAA